MLSIYYLTNTIVLNHRQCILCTYHAVNELKNISISSSTFAPVTLHPLSVPKQQQIEMICKNQNWKIDWATPIPTMITDDNIKNYTRRQTILVEPTDQLPSIEREKSGTFTSLCCLNFCVNLWKHNLYY